MKILSTQVSIITIPDGRESDKSHTSSHNPFAKGILYIINFEEPEKNWKYWGIGSNSNTKP